MSVPIFTLLMQKTGGKDIDALWHHFMRGNENCFSEIYQETINGLFLYGLKFSSDRQLVQDCLQEVFIDVFTIRKKVGLKIKKLKPYLFVAVRNGIIKRLTKEARIKVIGDYDANSLLTFSIDYSAEYKYINKEQNKEIQLKLKNAIENLAPKQKEIIYLKFEEELDYSDIADIMNITIESARKSMHRSILALRKILENSTLSRN